MLLLDVKERQATSDKTALLRVKCREARFGGRAGSLVFRGSLRVSVADEGRMLKQEAVGTGGWKLSCPRRVGLNTKKGSRTSAAH